MSKSWLSDCKKLLSVYHPSSSFNDSFTKPIQTSTELLSMKNVLTLTDILNVDGIQFINNTDTL